MIVLSKINIHNKPNFCTMPLKMAYITNVKIPNHEAVSEQVIHNLSSLAEFMQDVTLIIPNYTVKPILIPEIEKFYNVSIRFKIKTFCYLSFLPRTIKKNIFVFVAPLYARRMKYDLLYTRHPAILFYCLLFRQKTVFETYRIDINYRLKYRLWKWLCYKNKYLIGFIVHSNLAKKSLIEVGVEEKKVLLAYNGYSVKKTEEKDALMIRDSLNIKSDEKVVAYAGRVGTKAKRTDIILHLANALPEVKFLIIGAGKKIEDDKVFDLMIAKMKLKNVIRTGWVDPSKVQDYLQAADILIIPTSSDPLRSHGKTVLPMKTFMYMAAGKPIIAPDLPDIREILTDQINAILVEPDNFNALLNKIQNLILNDDLKKSIANRCLMDTKQFTWSNRAKRIYPFISKISYSLDK